MVGMGGASCIPWDASLEGVPVEACTIEGGVLTGFDPGVTETSRGWVWRTTYWPDFGSK
jgi:hypothetical protein